MMVSKGFEFGTAKLAVIALVVMVFNVGGFAHASSVQLVQNSSGMQAKRLNIDPDLRSKMRNIAQSRNLGQRVQLAKRLASQINGNRIRNLRSSQVERMLEQNLNHLIANDMGQIQNLLAQLQSMQSQFKDLAIGSGGGYGDTMFTSYYLSGGDMLMIHEHPRSGDAGHHTFYTYNKNPDGSFSQTVVTEFDLDENLNKSGRKKADGDGSAPPQEAFDFAENNPDGSDKNNIIAETEARMLIPQLVSVNNNLSTVESYLFSYMVSGGLLK